MSTRPLQPIANNIFRASDGTMYERKLGIRFSLLGEEHQYVSEGFRRLSPRKHILKKRNPLKADGVTKKRLKKWQRKLAHRLSSGNHE